MKCPYCKGKNLYWKRTSPTGVIGCHDCEKKIKYMKDCGMTIDQIKKVITRK